MKPRHAPVVDAVESRLDDWRAGVALVEGGDDQVPAALVEHEAIDALEDPTAETLAAVLRGDREDRRVPGAEGPAARVERPLQRQLEPDRLAARADSQDRDPPRVPHHPPQHGGAEVEPRLTGVVEPPSSIEHRQESREVEVVERRDREQASAVGALVEQAEHGSRAL